MEKVQTTYEIEVDFISTEEKCEPRRKKEQNRKQCGKILRRYIEEEKG